MVGSVFSSQITDGGVVEGAPNIELDILGWIPFDHVGYIIAGLHQRLGHPPAL